MATHSDYENAVHQISQNSGNRKSVYQTVSLLMKVDIDKKTTANTKLLFENPKVLEILEGFYSTRFILLCNETFSFLYQLCKLASRSKSLEAKVHITSLIPRLIVTYFYFISNPEDKKSDIDGLEILFTEMTKLDEDNDNKFGGSREIDDILHIFPEMEAISQNSVTNVYSKKLKSSLNLGTVLQENRIVKILEIFISYIHHYNQNTINGFLHLADMVAGVKVNLKDMHLSSTSEYTKDFAFHSDSSTKSKIIMKCISGLETVGAIMPTHSANVERISTNLALKSANSGQFLAYVYSEAKQTSQLDDVFS